MRITKKQLIEAIEDCIRNDVLEKSPEGKLSDLKRDELKEIFISAIEGFSVVGMTPDEEDQELQKRLSVKTLKLYSDLVDIDEREGDQGNNDFTELSEEEKAQVVGTQKSKCTRIEAIAVVLKGGQTFTKDQIIELSDSYYVECGGRNHNLKEQSTQWIKAKALLKAFGLLEESDGKFRYVG